MPSLRDLQSAFVDATFGGPGTAVLADWVVAGGMQPEARLAIYRRNVFHNLRDALRDVHPVVVRLVGDDFFAQTADAYIRDHRSQSGNLHDFGESFAGFLGGYAPADALPYLADTARVEWLVHRAFHAADHATLALSRLANIDAAEYGQLRFQLHPSCGFVASPYPVDRIWEVNQPGHTGPDTVDLGSGATRLLVRRSGAGVVIEALDAGTFALLSALATGGALSLAAAGALAANQGFALAHCLSTRVGDGTLVDCALPLC
jgi:hypothetical protein